VYDNNNNNNNNNINSLHKRANLSWSQSVNFEGLSSLSDYKVNTNSVDKGYYKQLLEEFAICNNVQL